VNERPFIVWTLDEAAYAWRMSRATARKLCESGDVRAAKLQAITRKGLWVVEPGDPPDRYRRTDREIQERGYIRYPDGLWLHRVKLECFSECDLCDPGEFSSFHQPGCELEVCPRCSGKLQSCWCRSEQG